MKIKKQDIEVLGALWPTWKQGNKQQRKKYIANKNVCLQSQLKLMNKVQGCYCCV